MLFSITVRQTPAPRGLAAGVLSLSLVSQLGNCFVHILIVFEEVLCDGWASTRSDLQRFSCVTQKH